MSAKKRLDVLVYERGFAESREKAKAVIMSGIIYVDNQKSDKPGTAYSEDVKIEMRGNKLKYVSRGGLKLEKAIDVFKIDLKDKTTMDIGASTGGFTDCMLQNGAKKVYSIDVGHGQLDWKLRNDDRVTVMERTNARNMAPDWFDQKVTFASIDVSFISLKLILPPLYQCLEEEGEVVALIKPQFEAGRNEVGKNGVIRDCSVHARICEEIMRFASNSGYAVKDLSYSPITGPKGNIEFLLYMQKSSTKNIPDEPDFQLLAQKTAESAHKTDAFLKS